ncbi:MAG: dethiobiotin synthase [Gallionella sp.]
MNYFVTGTDTKVGKTLISCALLHDYAAQGRRVVGMKPVSCDEEDRNEDVRLLVAESNVLVSLGQINPYYFERAVAPSLAAKFVGVRINLDRIVESYRELAAQAEVVIVEGVGGFRVPLNDEQDGVDLAKKLNLPVILVVGMRLGCQNHALLTVESILAAGLELAGWVANGVQEEMAMLTENIASLQQRIAAPLLGIVPSYPATPNVAEVAECLDMAQLSV